jgi:RHS repeat-associated protein
VWDKGYRYGFNSMEKDNEINVNGGSYDFGARIYDSRLGRWLSLDPLMKKYVHWSPYSYPVNCPIRIIDIDGMKPGDPFLTIEDAVKDFGVLYNDNSIHDSREYGAYVHKTRKNGKTYYTYNIPTKSWGSSFVRVKYKGVPFFRSPKAMVHTHGSYAKYSDNDFSDEDKEIAKSEDFLMYVVTPNGSLKVFDPKNESTDVISTEMPSDPKDKTSKKENHFMLYPKDEKYQENKKFRIWITKKLNPDDIQYKTVNKNKLDNETIDKEEYNKESK